MFDSLINTLLVIAGLYVYLSLYPPGLGAAPDGAAALGERQLGFPEAIAAALLVGWFILNVVAAAQVAECRHSARVNCFSPAAFPWLSFFF